MVPAPDFAGIGHRNAECWLNRQNETSPFSDGSIVTPFDGSSRFHAPRNGIAASPAAIQPNVCTATSRSYVNFDKHI